jgi:hypothetical protein
MHSARQLHDLHIGGHTLQPSGHVAGVRLAGLVGVGDDGDAAVFEGQEIRQLAPLTRAAGVARGEQP